MNTVKIKNFTGRKSQSGAILLILIISMVVMAIIGIAIYSLTYTAALNQLLAQRAAKAFYIAESGIRIAASEYKASSNKDTTLVNLNAKTFPMPNNPGQVKIDLYPYWFYLPDTAAPVAVTANTTTSIILYLPGAVPPTDDTGTTPITFPAGGQLRYKNDTTKGETYNTATPGTFNAANGGTPVTFTFTVIHHNTYTISPGDEFYLGYGYNSTATPAAAGDSLTLADPDNTWKIFPPKNGTIFVVVQLNDPSSICQYSYDFRDTSTANTVTLTNIQFIQCINLAQGGTYIPPVPFFPASTDTPYQYYIYIGKSLGIRSTSTYGD